MARLWFALSRVCAACLTLRWRALLPSRTNLTMHTNTANDPLPEVRARLRSARRVFVLTGAGVSAESGVPTFRGGGNAAVWQGMPFDVISSAEMVERDLPAGRSAER